MTNNSALQKEGPGYPVKAEDILSYVKSSEIFSFFSERLVIEESPENCRGPNNMVLYQANNFKSYPLTARVVGMDGSYDHFAPGNIIIFTYQQPVGNGKSVNFYFRILAEKSELISDEFKLLPALWQGRLQDSP